ncbi:MAG: hypothetical protein PF501_07615 [Salinisphaera sp.]|jgi:hypothetical protein|nr:hypothetical protein [Salinisphaera sp.]
MRLKSRTPSLASQYRPSSPAERRNELQTRNVHRLIDYFGRSAQHTLAAEARRLRARQNRRQNLRGAFLARRSD